MSIEEKLNFKTLEWHSNHLKLIDQTLLPDKLEYIECRETNDFVQAIKKLVVRGAPAIGCTAAYGIALAAKKGENLEQTANVLKNARPTAVNLAWAVERMMKLTSTEAGGPEALEQEAIAIHNEDAEMCRRMGKNGDKLIKDDCRILTHCNAGALATGGIGTALAVIYTAKFGGKNISVWVDETRPILQGARLTAWELGRAGVPHTLICDNMAASLIGNNCVDCVITGADRIAANYDVANKIGTYNLAVLCQYHKIPFYVAAPSSTFDFECPNGQSIIIENRADKEITAVKGQVIAPKGVNVFNPAFDVTPHELVTAIITEKETIRPV
ncbi:MAG: S-methyl-5-thioribose-1-phosphate isomerase [candidate division Zixibacteria bacterium]|nr:S-methyl-5-thioribose-1-phosphate isomerase [candidate division Zixibacteria bacterium]